MNKNMQNRYDIIIIGAGAAGMMASITAASQGKQVLVLEHLDKPGKKLLATGNGKCNYTNEYMDASYYRGNLQMIENILDSFSKDACLSFFKNIGIYPKCKNGYYYPYSEQASSVVQALIEEMSRLGVKLSYSTKIRSIKKHHNGVISNKEASNKENWNRNKKISNKKTSNIKQKEFIVETDKGIFTSEKLIVAAGLLAAPKLGSDGSLFPVLKSLGHHFTPVVPALCGFYCRGIPFRKVAGVRASGRVSAYTDGKLMASDSGELQFADYGLSGIPVFQISRHLSIGLYHKKKVQIGVNLLPELTEQGLLEELQNRCKKNPRLSVFRLLNGLLHQKLSDMIFELLEWRIDGKVSGLEDQQLKKLCGMLQNLMIAVEKPRDFEFAQVCAGGINSREVDCRTLESKVVPDLYFAGEILDVDGICGGYNLHFAWGSGRLAAMSACDRNYHKSVYKEYL